MGILTVLIALELAVVATAWIAPKSEERTKQWSWARVDTPPAGAARHIEIEAPGANRIWLNGQPLSPNDLGRYDVPWAIRKRNIVVRQPAGSIRAVIGPRVYIAAGRAESGKLRVTVRNTLENTANVFAGLRRGETTLGETAATVPPGVTQDIVIQLNAPLPDEALFYLDKEAEAMEGAYRHEVSGAALGLP
ncbi:MAG: hypothetical protein R2729_02380 [Bryobacteraceae bacterium]